MGQDGASQRDLTSARYIVDSRSEIDFTEFEDQKVWDLSNMGYDEEIRITSTTTDKLSIPFYGSVTKNKSGEIYQLSISDPFLKYGSRKVILNQPITIQQPEPESKTTGYSLILPVEDVDQSILNQLPILPDSIKISITAKITDSPWSYVSLNHKTSGLENRSFVRAMEVDRSVMIKISPFGWTAVNSVAPMIDWDKSFKVSQRFFIATEIDLPLAIVELRNGVYDISVLDFNKSKGESNVISGAPQIKAVPNPVINDVRFQISNVQEGSYTIKIKNILGEVKIEKKIQFISIDEFAVDIDDLRKGSYFYVLENDRGNVLSTKRLIVLKP